MLCKYLGKSFEVVLLLITLTVSSVAYSITISDVYIFGDSLSDASIGLSDGDLWPVYFSSQLGLWYNSGNNYAVAGATTGGLTSQVSLYLSEVSAEDTSALYVVCAGGNDIFTGGNSENSANNVIDTINTLSSFGAQNFLVANMPNLGLAPADGSGALTSASITFNSTIDLAFNSLSNVKIADVFGFHNNVLVNPTAFGLTNATDSCLSSGADCTTYLFWDDIHSTTAGHNLIATEFTSTVVHTPQQSGYSARVF